MSDGMGCECAARSESECCCAGVDWGSGREAFLEERVKELEEAIARHKKVMFGDTLPPFPDDQELYKHLGEPKK